jgi:enediyne biosynthesis protein E4
LIAPVVSLVSAIAFLAACGPDQRVTGSAATDGSHSAKAKNNRGDWFVDRAEDTGLRFSYFNGMTGEFYFPEMLPAGVALLDYDNDDDLDVYLVQGQMLGGGKTLSQATIPPTSLPLKGRLFRNDLQVHPDGTRTLHFTDITDQSGIDAHGYGMGLAAGDFNNDGCIDLYLTNLGSNQLFRNNCDITFTDVSKQSGTNIPGWSVSAAFVDYDRDGWLDLYVGNYVHWDIATDQKCTGLTGRRDYCTPAVYRPQRDRLFHNNGDGTFADVTATALIGGPFGPALGVVTADFNNDGWLDIYVANDGRDNVLWINQRNGTFKNTGPLSGAAVGADGKPKGSMGVDAGDFDNDGDEDLFTTQLPAEGNNLYVNLGSGLFDDVSASSGLGPMSLGYTGFGTAWFDVDNDGWLDLLAVNGAIEAIKERVNEIFPYGERKLLFRNLRNGRFENVTRPTGVGLQPAEVSRGAAFGDIDNDGDVDVVVGNINGPVRLLLNAVGNRKHWLGIRLVGARTRRDMLGARVEIVRPNPPTLWRRARSDGSYASANDPRVLVGLDASTELPTVRVHWPSGGVEEWRSVTIDKWTVLKEGEGAVP